MRARRPSARATEGGLTELRPRAAAPCARSAASIGLSLNWASNFAVALLFPLMASGLGDYAFLPFAAALAVFLVLTVIFVPETKGRSIEELTQSYGAGGINSDDK